MTQICNRLKTDFRLTIVTGKRSNLSKVEDVEGISIVRLPTLKTGKRNFISRFIALAITSLMFSFYCLVKVPRKSSVFIVTNPVFLLLFVSVISKIKSFQLYLLVHDVYPNNLVSAGVIRSSSSLFYNFLNRLFDFSYSTASQIIVLGRDMKEIIAKKSSRPISVIENWAQLKSIKPLAIRPIEKYIPSPHADDLVLMFAGNFGRVQALEQLMNFIDCSNEDEISFLFAGKGYYENQLQELSERNRNVFYVGPYKREEQIDILNACDVALVTLSEGMYGLGVPSKTYNLLAAGKPILYIGETDSEIDRLIKEYNIGWTINDYNKHTFNETIKDIKNIKPALKEMGHRCRALAESQYSEEIIADKFLKLFLS